MDACPANGDGECDEDTRQPKPHDCPHPPSPALSLYYTATTVFYYPYIYFFLKSVWLKVLKFNRYCNIFILFSN